MYNVSADFLAQLEAKARSEHVRGTVGSKSFNDSNVIKMSYTNRCSDVSDVTFGSAYIGQLEATFWNMDISRGDWKGKKIVLEYGLELADHTVEYIPAGVFWISKATWTATGVNIVANDCLAFLDKNMVIQTTSGNLFDFLNLAATNCGVQLGMTRAQMETLPNGGEILGIYAENDMKTWRDLVSWIAVTVGGYATATRDGKLVIRSFNSSAVVDTLDDEIRIDGSSFSDFTTLYSGISIVDIQSEEYLIYGAEISGGTYIKTGSNPLLQYGVDSIKYRQRMAIASVAQGIRWTPFQTSVLSCLVYDLGDLLTCSGGIAGSTSLTCAIMYIAWTFKSTTILGGYGADPALVSGKSKTDKALSGLSSKQKHNTSVTLYYTNAEAYSIGSSWLRIGQIAFATLSAQTVEVKGVVKVDLDTPGNVKLRYMYNDRVQPSDNLPFIHEVQLPIDKNTVAFFFPITIDANIGSEVAVEICVQGGTGTIAIQDVWMSITAVGAEAIDWAGIINASDSYSLRLVGKLTKGLADDSNDPDFQVYGPVSIGDIQEANYQLSLAGELNIALAEDDLDLVTEKPIYDIVSSDDLWLISTSDEDYYIQTS